MNGGVRHLDPAIIRMTAVSTPKATGAGSPPSLRLWPLPLLVAALLAVDLIALDLGSPSAMMVAALAIIIAGLPHGTLDVEIAALRFGRARPASKVRIIAAYLAAAAAMAMAWLAAPAFALAAFLMISIAHFAQDWRGGADPFFATMVGWSLIALPALSHPDDVAAIFMLLTAGASGGTVAALLACTAVPAAIGALLFVRWALIHGAQRDASEVACCIVAALLLPPLIAFAIFFCLLHSPRHMADALREAGPMPTASKALVIAAVMLLAIAMGAVIFWGQPGHRIEDNVIRSAFILLSILTVPHFLLEQAMARRPDPLGTRP